MEKRTGYPLPFGISVREQVVNFSVAVESGKACNLYIYEQGSERPTFVVELPEEEAIGEVRFVGLLYSEVKGMEYNYQVDGEFVLDPYVKAIVPNAPVRGKVLPDEYDWEDDKPLEIPYHEVIAYNLHVRGFTKHPSSKVKHKGTFAGVVEKISYLKELGINQIQCMPVYSFVETKQYQNYWGYGEAFCFAPKASYAASEEPGNELKDMIKACHRNGIEVVLHLPFSTTVPKQLIEECLRYYVLDYHVDGFLLNPYIAPMEAILSDPLLKKTKILQNRDDFQNTMRAFLRGDEGMVQGVMWWLKERTLNSRSCNYITNHTGFTLADLVSYDRKHNELNGENNQDGPDANYSWNCGVEGPTRKKSVLSLRKRQMRNAMFLLMLAQGTPCILAGDEFGNSQGGNNNVYCQDNEIAWLDWKKTEKESDFLMYVKQLITLRKQYALFHLEKPLLGVDKTGCGIPDISFHGEEAWQIPNHRASCRLGVYYHGIDDTDCFVAYNMHCEAYTFALPVLPKRKKWYRVCSTAEEPFAVKEQLEKDQRTVGISERTIVMFVGK